MTTETPATGASADFLKHPVRPTLPPGKEFAVWLSHDVDRVRKSALHAVYYGFRERNPAHLASLLPGRNPYWNFYSIMELEARYGAKSTFFMLNETIKPSLSDPRSFVLALGRYRITEPAVRKAIRDIDESGWEIGLHGSYNSFKDHDLLKREKEALEDIVGHAVRGGRQHWLNLDIPGSWEIHRAVGLKYDASFGFNAPPCFRDEAYYPFRPFNDAFLVIPLAMMDGFLMHGGKDRAAAERVIDEMIDRCRNRKTILAALWHHRILNEAEFPDLYRLYVYLLESVSAKNGIFALPTDDTLGLWEDNAGKRQNGKPST